MLLLHIIYLKYIQFSFNVDHNHVNFKTKKKTVCPIDNELNR